MSEGLEGRAEGTVGVKGLEGRGEGELGRGGGRASVLCQELTVTSLQSTLYNITLAKLGVYLRERASSQ